MQTNEAIRHFGSVAALAERLEISVQAIYQWGRTVPEAKAFKLQVLTRGALRAVCDNPRPKRSAAATPR